MGIFSKKNNKDESKKDLDIKAESAVLNEEKNDKGNKKTKANTSSKTKVSEKKKSNSIFGGNINMSNVIIRPRVTEKGAVVATSSNAYIFDVYPDANKIQIAAAIQKIYKVTPLKINITKVPAKKIRIRGERRKTGIKPGGKKAIVYLKSGEKIEFI